MDYPFTRRHPATPPPPSLVRSRSGSENNSSSTNTSQRFTTRSKSTARSRNTQIEDNVIKSSSSTARNKPANQEICSRDGFVRFLQRGASPRNSMATKKPKSTSSSPSAWALSPGRSSLFNMFTPEFPVMGGEIGKAKGGGGAVSGVFKYFRQKKASPVLEDEYHRFRVSLNRLLQWRFANARAEATISSHSTVAQDKLFHVWIRIFIVRNSILEKRIEIQKLKRNIKSCEIIKGQMSLLNEWSKIESKNCEAVSRMTRNLSALSAKLPLVEEAKGDVGSIYKAMNTAEEFMGNIEATITKFLSRVEKMLYLLTELTSTLEHQKESLGEMERVVILLSQLLPWEKSIRVQLIQMMKESRREHDF